MLIQTMHVLAAACDTHKIKLPARITEAGKVVEATQALAAQVRAEAAPDPYSLTAENLTTLHAAMVAWPMHAERQAAADRLAAVAQSDRLTAWDGFANTLLEAFRKPFDNAVARLLTGDATALQTVRELTAVRDELANTGTRAKMRSFVFERATRLMVVPSYDVVLNRIGVRTEGMEPYSPAWVAEVHGLGCEIKWQTPAEQEAADRVTPANTPAPSAA